MKILTTFIRNLLFIFGITFSIVFFVSCQREVDEILEENPPPEPDSSNKRLKAVYFLLAGGSQDTTDIFEFKYDNLGRLISQEHRGLTDNYYVELRLYYQGADKYPFLIIDSTNEFNDYQAIDSTFIFYDPLGRISHDSAIVWSTNSVSWPDFNLDDITVHKLTYFDSSSVKIERTIQSFDGSGGVSGREDEVLNINFLQNSPSVFELEYEFRDFSDFYYDLPEYTKYEFSQYHNPYKGLLPPFPYMLQKSKTDLVMEGNFPFYWSRIMYDRADGFPDNIRFFVESHIDSFPTRVRLEYYNVPGWVETQLFEYE